MRPKNHEHLAIMQPELCHRFRRYQNFDQDWEDRFQDLNLRLLQKADAIRNFPHYARRAAKNARHHATRRLLHLCHPDNLDVVPDPKSISLAHPFGEKADHAILIRQAIKTLPPRYRIIVENRLDGAKPGDRRERKLYCQALRILRERLAEHIKPNRAA